MRNRIEEFCMTCGFTGGIDKDWHSNTQCMDCKRKSIPKRHKLDKSVWGYVCEDHVNGMDIIDLGYKYHVLIPVIINIIERYEGTKENPVMVTFKPDEEVIVPKPKEEEYVSGDYVRVVKVGSELYGRIKQVHKRLENGYYRLRNCGNVTFSPTNLERYYFRQQDSFNV